MDWVHCNNCFMLPDGGKSFFLTSCGHIYCCDCKEQCARGLCKLCGNQCTTILLSSSMKPDVQKYFSDPSVLLKRNLKEVQQVAEFQKNHRARLVTHERKQLAKFKGMKENFQKLLKALKDLDSEKKRLSQENRALKNYIGVACTNKPFPEPCTSNSGSARRVSKGQTKSPYDNISPYSHKSPVFSKFFDKMDNSCLSHPEMPQRLSVITPPMNGKMGVIPGTPSPSSAFRNLNISSAQSNESQRRGAQLFSPFSSQESTESCTPFLTPNTTASPADQWNLQNEQNNKVSSDQRNARKMVVHPYTPED